MKTYCFGCRQYHDESSMLKVVRGRGKVTRLMCQRCLNRTNASWYAKTKKDDKRPCA